MAPTTAVTDEVISQLSEAIQLACSAQQMAAIEQKANEEGTDLLTAALDLARETPEVVAALDAFGQAHGQDPFQYVDPFDYEDMAARTWREAMDEYRDAVLADPSARGSFRQRWEQAFAEAAHDAYDFHGSAAVDLQQVSGELDDELYHPLGEHLSALTGTYITPDEVEEYLKEYLVRAVAEASYGEPTNLLKRCEGAVEFSYTPGWGVMSDGSVGYLDDVMTSHQGPAAYVDSVIWDRHMASVFNLFNVSPDEFLIYLRHTYFACADGEPCPEVDAIEEAMKGEFRDAVKFDPSRPSLCSPKDMAEIIDNASYGGVPCVTGKIRISDLYRWDEDRPAVITNDNHCYVMAGIHDPINGSGHLEGFRGDFVLPAGSLLQCRLSGAEGYPPGEKPRHYGTDTVYGFASWRIRLEQAPAPTQQPESEGPTP